MLVARRSTVLYWKVAFGDDFAARPSERHGRYAATGFGTPPGIRCAADAPERRGCVRAARIIHVSRFLDLYSGPQQPWWPGGQVHEYQLL